MGMNFNIVKKPGKTDDDEDEDLKDEEEEEIEVDVEEESDTKKSSSDDPKKKMIRLMGIIVLVTVGLLLLLFIVSSVSGSKKTYKYSEIESIMKKAAVSYFKDHADYLPQDTGSVVEVDVNNLIAEEKMDDLSEYLEDGITCTGSVQVEKTDTDYLYTPYLNCGDKYSTVQLYKKIISDNNTVTTGYGLYSNGGNYVFRGENANNFVQLDNALWRIVKVTSSNEVVLIYADTNLHTVWDDRYNPEYGHAAGINQYSASRIKEYMEKIYDNVGGDEEEAILSDKDKSRLVPYNVCVGKRVLSSTSKDNHEECSEIVKNQKMGLLSVSDYIYASVDPNCKETSSKSCQNYNYLVIKDDWWTATANKDNSYEVYQVSVRGVVSIATASAYGIVRPVVHLNSNVLYKSGNGTEEKPYKVR